jgi:hypothetical protein
LQDLLNLHVVVVKFVNGRIQVIQPERKTMPATLGRRVILLLHDHMGYQHYTYASPVPPVQVAPLPALLPPNPALSSIALSTTSLIFPSEVEPVAGDIDIELWDNFWLVDKYNTQCGYLCKRERRVFNIYHVDMKHNTELVIRTVPGTERHKKIAIQSEAFRPRPVAGPRKEPSGRKEARFAVVKELLRRFEELSRESGDPELIAACKTLEDAVKDDALLEVVLTGVSFCKP